jgi:hypothetical protein
MTKLAGSQQAVRIQVVIGNELTSSKVVGIYDQNIPIEVNVILALFSTGVITSIEQMNQVRKQFKLLFPKG